MEDDRYLEFVEEDIDVVCGYNKYVITFPVNNQGELNRLRMWVAYDLGSAASFEDYKPVPRGFYLYISQEKRSSMCRILEYGDNHNQRVFLMAVDRKSERAYREASKRAGRYARTIIETLCDDLDVDWNNGYARSWSGDGSGVGMWSDMYPITYFDFDEAVVTA